MAAGQEARVTAPLRLLAAAAGAVVLLATAATAQAAVVGLADQQPGSYGDPRVQALGLRYARLTVPWDAATSEPQAVAAWLAAVSAAGMAPHVAFEHLAGDRCPGQPCTTPTAAQYGAAIRRFVARFPEVRTYTTWNEANHASQPVADDPEAVAAYYDELRAACAGCTIVAGDVLDSGAYRRWLERFRRASTTTPRLWGLHDYGDVTYGRTTGVDTVLAAVPGRLWIEETRRPGRHPRRRRAPDAGRRRDRRRPGHRSRLRHRGGEPPHRADVRLPVAGQRGRPLRRRARAPRRHRAAELHRRSPATSRPRPRCVGRRRGPRAAPGACCCAPPAPRPAAPAAAA